MSIQSNKKEAFSRIVIDAQLKDVGWNLTDGQSVRYEYQLPDGTFADYVLSDRHGRAMAVVEAKRAAVNLQEAADQGRAYAEQLDDVPYVFLANGEEILFWDYRNEAYPHPVSTFFKQEDLERRLAKRKVRVDPLTKPIDKRIAGRDYQKDCIDTLCAEMNAGQRKLLVEMATGTGKTRTAAALIKRLFEASAVTRVLFLVDRITLAKQTEDAFNEHLTDYPCYVLRAGRRFQDEKRITITTLQSMINVYRDYSAGYFDLIITDECHRSIYGKWSGILKYFDGVQIGLTATPFTSDIESGDEEDQSFVRDTLRFFEVEEPTYRYTLREAVNEGYLVPYQIYKAKTVKSAKEGGFEVKKNELDWSAMSSKVKEEFNQLFADSDTIKVDPNALERKFTIPERNRAIVREYRQVMEDGYTDHTGRLRKPLIGKTIVFAVTKRHAETLAQMFDEAFAHEKPSPDVRYADFVVSGCGREDSVDGATKIKRFKKERFPQILVSVNMLDTGFDAPEVVNLIMARFTRSVILYRQMRGRGTRKSPGKSLFTLFDFVGVTDYHDDDETMPEGGFIKETRPRTRHEPRTLLTLDIDDHIDPATREWVTIDDNGNFVFMDADEVKAALRGARFEAWMGSQNHLNSDMKRLLLTMGEYIKANADTLEEFTIDHFVVPPFSNIGGMQRAVQSFGTEENLAKTIKSLNRAIFAYGESVHDEQKQPNP
ncbi:MAG: DEAD/DEAH box helicase family protein [Candidatus Thiodiazotropha sp. (ex Troendleina suluensis)]|nr:DEAD/DEAH box helicase family protein [Candidatus Thiodiazotropha sp. (ex Troendleina suluensis)]